MQSTDQKIFSPSTATNHCRMHSIQNRLSKTFSIAIIQKKIDDISGAFHIMKNNPSLVKIVFNYNECFLFSNDRNQSEVYENNVKKIGKQLWLKYKVLYVYFIPFCWYDVFEEPSINLMPTTRNETVDVEKSTENDLLKRKICLINDVFVYNAFQNVSVDFGTSGSVYKYKVKFNNSPSEYELYNLNEFLRQQNQFNFNQLDFRVSFFPTTMAYLKQTSRFYNKKFIRRNQKLTDNQQKTNLSSKKGTHQYFGLDIEILKELGRRMNFTPKLVFPADNFFYGLRVIQFHFRF